MQKLIELFESGVHNIISDEIIPADASSFNQNWRTINGKIELMRGRELFGNEGGAGAIEEEHKAFRADGTSVLFRKTTTKIQYYNSATETWTDVITGLTAGVPVVFSNYQSLAGTFCYIFSTEGLWKIHTANPTSYADQYLSTKNFKGYGLIDNARTLLWGTEKDPTGLYGSYIDAQNSDVYTTVSAEALSNVATGTLAFKAGGSRRTCFGVVITVTGSGQVFTDDYNGVLTGDQGGVGTINYMTGAYTTDDTGAGTVDYQWEDATAKGVLDFSKSATRLAGEGFILRQDLNGDPIQTVLPLEGAYYSIKQNSAYRYIPDTADENPTNEVFRTDIGVPSKRSAIATGSGIVFLNTANPDKPILTILERNPVGDNIVARELVKHFDFAKYTFTNSAIATHNRYVMIACAEDSSTNNRVLVIDVQANTVDIGHFAVASFMKDAGVLYAGEPASENTYKLFNGFDDDGDAIDNEWLGRGERFDTNALKKLKKLRLKGEISPDQIIKVYMSYDDSDFQLVGTIRGDAEYVDVTNGATVGSNMIGEDIVGGDGEETVYPFFLEIKLKNSKFRKAKIKFQATSIGYASINYQNWFDIWEYEEKIPSKYRLKQNVSLDGLTTDNANPEF